MFNLSPLLLKCGIAAALFFTLVVFEIVTRLSDAAKIRSGEAEDMRKNNTALKRYNAIPLPKWRWVTEAALIILTGTAIIVAMASMVKYQSYGAFYDGSWRMPDVESHMLFRSDGTEALQDIYNNDPENFVFDDYRICLVRMGCPDCENVHETINSLSDGFYIVFDRSDIGRKFVDHYNITFIPSVIYNGTILELRTDTPSGSDDGYIPELDGPRDTAPGAEDVPDMLDGLLDDGFGTGHELQPGNPGTAAGIGIVDEEQKKAGENGN